MAEVVKVLLSSIMVDSSFPELPGKLESAGFACEVCDNQDHQLVIVQMSDLYKTHLESIRGDPGSRERRILFCDKSYEYLDRPDVHVVINVPAPGTDEHVRVSRVLDPANRARFVDIRSRKSFSETLVNVVTCFQKAKDKKVPNEYNVYQTAKVETLNEKTSIFANMLAQIPGVSHDIARGISEYYKTLEAMMNDLENIGSRSFPTNRGSKTIGQVVTGRLQVIFGADSKEDEYIDR